jgi:RNA polymerase sigma-70 factor (ECF subfamily)
MSNAGLAELVTSAGWLRRLAVGLLGDRDAAEDVVQGTLVTAWVHPPDRDREVRPWLAEVARNQALDQKRSASRRAAREAAAQVPDPPSTPEQLIGDLEIHRLVAEVVCAQDEPYRSTLVTHYYDGVPAVEMARRLKVPAGTVRWRLKEGLDRVRVELDRRQHGDRRRWRRALLPLVPLPRARTWPALAAFPAAGLLVVAVGAAFQHPWSKPAAAPIGTVSSAGPRAPTTPPRFLAPLQLAASESPPLQDPAASAALANDIIRRMLVALIERNYDDFLLDAGDVFKAASNRDLMARIDRDLGQRLRAGYQLTALTGVRKTEGAAFLFKVEFADGGDDLVLTLVLDGNRVVGFLQQ